MNLRPIGSPGTSEEIARLEAELDEQQEAADRSLRVMHLSQAGAWVGVGLFAYGLYAGWALGLVGGIALSLGGFVLYGSTRSTRQQMLAAMDDLDAKRSDLIDQLHLQAR